MVMTGGCNCGKIRYEVGAEPMATVICHCRNCQIQSGSAFSVVMVVPSAALKVRGKTKVYEDRKTDSGRVLYREFCGDCGSALFSRQDESPQQIVIKTGTLDDVSRIQPQMHVWTSTAQPWVKIDPSMPQYEGNPSL